MSFSLINICVLIGYLDFEDGLRCKFINCIERELYELPALQTGDEIIR